MPGLIFAGTKVAFMPPISTRVGHEAFISDRRDFTSPPALRIYRKMRCVDSRGEWDWGASVDGSLMLYRHARRAIERSRRRQHTQFIYELAELGGD